MSDSNGNTNLNRAGEAGSSNALLNPDTVKAQEELRRIEQIVSNLTGLPSNGNVELQPEPGWHGMKPFRCSIYRDSAPPVSVVR